MINMTQPMKAAPPIILSSVDSMFMTPIMLVNYLLTK